MDTAARFYNLLDRDSIYDVLFDYLSPAGIFRTARTCRLARLAAIDYRTRAFDIHKHLRRFFADPLGFRILQAQTGAVISGSNALQFLDRDIYPESDLDIFVHVSSALQVCTWISESAGHGYVFVPNEKQEAAGFLHYQEAIRKFNDALTGDCFQDDVDWNSYDQSISLLVINFASSTDLVKMRRVQVIITGGLVIPMAKILSFHSTVVINAITYRAAYSLFPKDTFENRRLLEFRPTKADTTTASALNKYYKRGWQNFRPEESMTPECFSQTFGIGKRWVDDSKSWVIPFDIRSIEAHLRNTSSVQSTSLDIDPFSLNSFSVTYSGLGYSPNGNSDFVVPTSVQLTADFDVINSAFFSRLYTACPEFSSKIPRLLWPLHEHLQEEPTLTINPSDATFRIFNKICQHHCACNSKISKERFTYEGKLYMRNMMSRCKANMKLQQIAGMLLKINSEFGEDVRRK